MWSEYLNFNVRFDIISWFDCFLRLYMCLTPLGPHEVVPIAASNVSRCQELNHWGFSLSCRSEFPCSLLKWRSSHDLRSACSWNVEGACALELEIICWGCKSLFVTRIFSPCQAEKETGRVLKKNEKTQHGKRCTESQSLKLPPAPSPDWLKNVESVSKCLALCSSHKCL